MDENIMQTEAFEDDWSDVVDEILNDGSAEDAEVTESEANASPGDDSSPDEVPADQPEAEETGEPDDGEPAQEAKPEADHFELKHLDEVRTVGRDEVIALAQKGLDYDRIRGKLDESKRNEKTEADEKNAEIVSLLSEIAKEQNIDVQDFLDHTRATILANKDNLEFDVALQKIKLDNEKKQLEREKQKLVPNPEQDATAKRDRDISEFMHNFPGVAPETIPGEVWSDVSNGLSLVAAYAKYENAKLKAELAAKEQKAKNKARSTGSKKSVGNTITDEIDRYWDEI